MASITDAETGTAFVKCQATIAIRRTLVEIVHSQLATPVHVDTACAVGTLTNFFV